jgi:AcrR family transcriptional regulator
MKKYPGVCHNHSSAGWDKLTIRRMASHLGFSTTMIYANFPNKERIIFELMRLGFFQLRLALEITAQTSTLPCSQLENRWPGALIDLPNKVFLVV